MNSNSPALPRLPARKPDSHKGDYGRALLIGGSRGMAGAISLAGMAALRSGAGLVTLAVPDVCLETVASFEPSYMTVPLGCDELGRIDFSAKDKIAEVAQFATCIGCGPGIGRTQQLTELTAWMHRKLAAPIVFDADALFALAQIQDVSNHAGPRILTPHAGEFSRLIGDNKLDRPELERRAEEYARLNDVTLVLKGNATFITDGHNAVHNATGNPGLATGGSGDVLTGVITALICQGLSPFDAARLGAHVHGAAGDLAAQHIGQTSMIATDVIRYLAESLDD